MSNTHTIYQQLADFIQGKIETNEYNFGAKIPSEREFSGVSLWAAYGCFWES